MNSKLAPTREVALSEDEVEILLGMLEAKTRELEAKRGKTSDGANWTLARVRSIRYKIDNA